MEIKLTRFKTLALTSVLLVSAVAGVSYAQQAQDAPPPPAAQAAVSPGQDGCDAMGGRHADRGGPGKHEKHSEGRGMRMIDANADGVVGEDEAAAMADGMFMRLDQDRDGKLTEAEFTALPHGRGGWFNWSNDEAEAVAKVRKEKFASLDADKNASLNKAEFFADAKAKLASADTDKDGKVTPWEFRAQN
jgi:EF-hand domain pair/EF hand